MRQRLLHWTDLSQLVVLNQTKMVGFKTTDFCPLKERKMRFLSILTLVLVVSGYSSAAHALHTLNDAQAFSGLTEANAIYDVRTADKERLQFIFTVMRDTLREARQQNIKTNYVATMRGPTVKLLTRDSTGDPTLQKKIVALIGELNRQGVRLEACGYALNLFGLEEEDLLEGIHAVGNSINSMIGYQAKGYALVSMN
jgi:intracellular sulfur oxidation DsrE/DsrF family protein